uniref:Uncharacterized protein n=1 Tax=Molossus molossus TaxID=27622 RepID=A0A7J8DBT9_MOLMO|nr:hypothetical protein HJG59_009336 [Molossus molossus]
MECLTKKPNHQKWQAFTLLCFFNLLFEEPHFDGVTSSYLWARLEMKSIFLNHYYLPRNRLMRTWCVSLTMHGTSKLIIHNAVYPASILESGKSLRHLQISAPRVPRIPVAGWGRASDSCCSRMHRSP